jgi:hypothetical protein
MGLAQGQSGVGGKVAADVVEPGAGVLEGDRKDGARPAGQHAYWAGLPELRCVQDDDEVLTPRVHRRDLETCSGAGGRAARWADYGSEEAAP